MKPFNETAGAAMKNATFKLECWKYMFGQFRIQVLNRHGGILREMCTYKAETYTRVWRELSDAEDPTILAQSWARPWNCEGPGGAHKVRHVGV